MIKGTCLTVTLRKCLGPDQKKRKPKCRHRSGLECNGILWTNLKLSDYPDNPTDTVVVENFYYNATPQGTANEEIWRGLMRLKP
jgi:hypothetical protein